MIQKYPRGRLSSIHIYLMAGLINFLAARVGIWNFTGFADQSVNSLRNEPKRSIHLRNNQLTKKYYIINNKKKD